jgi:hypothetical protein
MRDADSSAAEEFDRSVLAVRLTAALPAASSFGWRCASCGVFNARGNLSLETLSLWIPALSHSHGYTPATLIADHLRTAGSHASRSFADNAWPTCMSCASATHSLDNFVFAFGQAKSAADFVLVNVALPPHLQERAFTDQIAGAALRWFSVPMFDASAMQVIDVHYELVGGVVFLPRDHTSHYVAFALHGSTVRAYDDYRVAQTQTFPGISAYSQHLCRDGAHARLEQLCYVRRDDARTARLVGLAFSDLATVDAGGVHQQIQSAELAVPLMPPPRRPQEQRPQHQRAAPAAKKARKRGTDASSALSSSQPHTLRPREQLHAAARFSHSQYEKSRDGEK